MDTFNLVSIIICSLLVLYYYYVQKQKYWEKRGIPTAKVKSVPILGHMWRFIMFKRTLGEILEDCYNSTDSSMVGVYNFTSPELLIKDVKLIKEIMQTQFSKFSENGVKIDHKKDPLLSKNPFFNDGEVWKKERSVLTNTMSTTKLRNIGIAVSEVCNKFDEFLQKQIKLNNGSYVTKAEELFGRFTSEVVAGAGFGIEGNSFIKDEGNFLEAIKKIFEPTGLAGLKQTLIFLCPSVGKIIDGRFIPVKMDQYFRGIVKEVLDVRKQGKIRGNDFIQQVYDSYKSESGEIDETFITGHALSFIIDGYFTASYTLSYIVFELAVHADVQEKLRQEIKQVLEKHENKITYETIQEMKYMDLVIQESMRLLPVISFLSRICTEECKLVGSDGLEVVMRPGDKILLSPNGIQKDSKYWKNPKVFDPERFKEENNDSKFTNLAFGAGPRMCPGMRMALLQMKGALTKLLDNYSLELSSKTKLPLTFDVATFLNVVKGGIWINIKPL
ncbi:cytochrome P450 6j1-like [Chelonus insularis]|uniref:cytochrome P450 6j1-like n=1 Tax=Chelonus insularis TaxID=460826 RepID=UPI001589E2C4|nr:cytochrome P450 6j1-like [Chelonus insularis]